MAVAATPRGLARVFLPEGGMPTPPLRGHASRGQESACPAKGVLGMPPAEKDAAERFEKSAEREILEYLACRRREFTVPLDLAGLPPFHAKVLAAARRIPYGRTATYGELATRTGSPRAARAVGQAMAHNPVPLVIPCHRVLAAGGRLGGYGGGLDLKRRLLDLESRG
jgi:methylated-DNA-[protein]-cysteine S-methyltransferase